MNYVRNLGQIVGNLFIKLEKANIRFSLDLRIKLVIYAHFSEKYYLHHKPKIATLFIFYKNKKIFVFLKITT